MRHLHYTSHLHYAYNDSIWQRQTTCIRFSGNWPTVTNAHIKLITMSGRPSFASKTTFEALAVDSGEESEEEVVEAPVLEPTR